MFGGVHYYTGQLFDIETITRVAHEQVEILIFRKKELKKIFYSLQFVGLLCWMGFSTCCRKCSITIT